MHYYIRPLSNLRESFEVAKFDPDEVVPIDTYITNVKQEACTCPSYKQPCKHVKMVTKWIAQEKPIGTYFDDQTDSFHNTPFANFGWLDRIESNNL